MSGLDAIDDQDFSPAPQQPGSDDLPAEEQVENQPFDEAMELTDESSVSDAPDSEPEPPFMSGGDFGDNAMMVTNQSYDEAIDISDATSVTPNATGERSLGGGSSSELDTPGRNSPPGAGAFNDDSDSTSESDDDEEGQMTGEPAGEAVFKPIEGGYNPEEFENLDVSSDITELFMYITRFQATQIELESTLKPFIPEFIPAVGDIDAFLRIPRPDSVEDDVGLKVLDEPTLTQTDRTVLEMQLRAFSKQSGLAAQTVAQIEEAQTDTAAIKKWISSVEELHTTKPATGVTFTRPMPDVENLMQVWPKQFEDMLGNVPLPPPHLDTSVEEYARICCALLDIPVHDNVVHSLHMLCMLYSEFKSNQHFGGGTNMQ